MIDFIYIFKSKRKAWEFLISPDPFIIAYPKQIGMINAESMIYLGCMNYWGRKKDDKTPVVFGRGKINYILTNYIEKLPEHLLKIIRLPEHVLYESKGLTIRIYFKKSPLALMNDELLERNSEFRLIFPLVRLVNWPKKNYLGKFIPFDGNKFSDKLRAASINCNHKSVNFFSNFKVPKYKLNAENL